MKFKPLLSAFGLMLLYSCATAKPLVPCDTAVTIPNIVQPLSIIEMPVSVDLKNYIVKAESSVPTKYADNQQPCATAARLPVRRLLSPAPTTL